MTMGVGKNVLLPAHVKQYQLFHEKTCSMPVRSVVFFLQNMKILSHKRWLFFISFFNTGCFVPKIISSFKTRWVMRSF
jgi:hypothetical protein